MHHLNSKPHKYFLLRTSATGKAWRPRTNLRPWRIRPGRLVPLARGILVSCVSREGVVLRCSCRQPSFHPLSPQRGGLSYRLHILRCPEFVQSVTETSQCASVERLRSWRSLGHGPTRVLGWGGAWRPEDCVLELYLSSWLWPGLARPGVLTKPVLGASRA